MASLWTQTCDLPTFEQLRQDVKTKVLIIGGGMAGLLCAYRLTQAGVDCLLVEADRIARGVTAGTTAKLTAQHGLTYQTLLRRFGVERAHLYYETNEAALRQYRLLVERFPCDWAEADHYVYTLGATRRLERELEALDVIGARAEYVRRVALPFPVSGAIRFPQQAHFHPLKFAAGLSHGLNIFEKTPVRSFDGARYHTDHATITAEKVIVATHFPIWNKHGLYPLKLYQSRSYVLALQGAPVPDGMYLDEAEDGLSFRPQGEYLLLGGGAHRTGKKSDGWAGLEAFAARYYPEAKIRFRWAAQDCMPLDDVPYIGRYAPSTPNLFVATGFHKWGMTGSMVAAMLLCDLVQGKENRAAALYAPDRSILRPQLFSNAAHAIGSLLTPTKPRCPHMGCALKWNRQEHSWDCPCHGSRFAQDGKLLNDPATGDLHR